MLLYKFPMNNKHNSYKRKLFNNSINILKQHTLEQLSLFFVFLCFFFLFILFYFQKNNNAATILQKKNIKNFLKNSHNHTTFLSGRMRVHTKKLSYFSDAADLLSRHAKINQQMNVCYKFRTFFKCVRVILEKISRVLSVREEIIFCLKK